MLIKLSNVLDVPLRERNLLLLAAGHAPLYRETPLDDPRMAQVRAALELILKQNEPRSALAFDRHWNIVMGSGGAIPASGAEAGQCRSARVPSVVVASRRSPSGVPERRARGVVAPHPFAELRRLEHRLELSLRKFTGLHRIPKPTCACIESRWQPPHASASSDRDGRAAP